MRLIIALFFIFIAFPIFSQNITVTYSEKRNVDEQLQKIPDPALRAKLKKDLTQAEYYKLQIKQPLSLYFKTEEENNDAGKVTQSNVQVMEFKSDAGAIYIDFSKNSFLQNLSLLGKSFLINDSIPKYDWVIGSEEVKIGDLLCKKATASIDGEEITAWFTEEIPISAGPAKLGGLPGLILKAKTSNKEYEAVEISNAITERTEFKKPVGDQEVNFHEYEKIKNEKINQLQSGKW